MSSIRFLGLPLKVFNRIGGVSNQMKILKKREFFQNSRNLLELELGDGQEN